MNLESILVAVDFSDVTPKVLDAALSLAKPFGSRVVLVHVSEPEPDFVGFEAGPPVVRTDMARDFRTEHQQLDELKRQVTQAGIDCVALHIQGPLADKILKEAEVHRAGLILIGSHGHGALYNLVVGSVASGLLKESHIPVLVIPAKASAETEK